MYLQKEIRTENAEKNLFLVGILKVTDGNVIKCTRYKDPDPYENVTDPEHCQRGLKAKWVPYRDD